MKKKIAFWLCWMGMAVMSLGADLVNVSGASNIALNGYDPVAFFTLKRATHGDPGITLEHGGAVYLFANKEHKEKFQEMPERFLPQYGGFCAYGVSVGALFPVDIHTWQIRDGKLYMNLNSEILKLFNKNVPKNVSKAEKEWPDLVKKHSH